MESEGAAEMTNLWLMLLIKSTVVLIAGFLALLDESGKKISDEELKSLEALIWKAKEPPK